MKTHLEWYKTPCGSHNKSEVRVIRSQFGLEGVAQWHILKNTIAGSDNCQINLNVQSNIMSLQADLEMNALELQNFINFLHEVCNIIDYKDNIISSKEISFWLKKVIEKRQRDSENVARKRSENTF